MRDRISARTHVQIALVVLAVGGLAYSVQNLETALKCAFFYLPLWALAEFFHWARMREAAKCRVCDFDPVLYRRNPLEARKVVEARLKIHSDNLKGELDRRKPRLRPAGSDAASPTETRPASSEAKVGKPAAASSPAASKNP